jgi:hypothetical protein
LNSDFLTLILNLLI